jgi:phage gpG-like protein
VNIPEFTGEVEGGDESIEYVTSLDEAIRRELYTVVDKLGSELLMRAKRIAVRKLNKNPKGNLVGAINKETRVTDTEIISIVGISLGTIPYARIHEFGGTIYPKNGPYLTFRTPDGEWHKVKSVTIPERSYLREALSEMPNTIEKQVRLGLQRAAAASKVKHHH